MRTREPSSPRFPSPIGMGEGGVRHGRRRAVWWLMPVLLVIVIGRVAWSRVMQAQVDFALIRAIEARNIHAVETALDNGADPAATEQPEMSLRSVADYWRILTGRSLKAPGPPAMLIAAKLEFWDAIEAMVRLSNHRNTGAQHEKIVLIMAASAGATECCLAMIKHGVDPNARGEFSETALIEAAQAGRNRTVIALLGVGADPKLCSMSGRTVLTAGAGFCSEATIRRLLDAGADVNAADRNGTALMAAAEQNNMVNVLILLEHHARTDLKGSGASTLAYAAHFGNVPMLDALMKAGAQANGAGEWSPIMQALRVREYDHDPFCNPLETVKLLLQHGASPNVRGDSNDTPLIQAIDSGWEDVARILVKSGADVNAVDGLNLTALDHAEGRPTYFRNPGRLCRFLRNAGGLRSNDFPHHTRPIEPKPISGPAGVPWPQQSSNAGPIWAGHQ